MKIKTYHTVKMVPKSIRKIVEKGAISMSTFILHIEWQNLVYKR